MTDIITPFSPEYTIHIPEDPIVWLFLGAWFLLILVCLLVFRDRKVSLNQQYLSWLAILSALVLLLTPFLGVKLFPDMTVQAINMPVNHLMFFAAVPWMLAAGVLGVIPSCLIAGISGLLLSYLDTHQITTPLLFMTGSIIFSLVIRQSRLSRIARILRLPAVGAIITWIISAPVVFVSMIFSASGAIALRFAFAFEHFPQVFLSLGGMILFGGIVVTLIRLFLPKSWLVARPLELAEKHRIKIRIIVQVATLFLVIMSVFVISIWRISENTARNILVEQLTDSAGVAAEGMALFVTTGKSQVEDIAQNDELALQEPEALTQLLAQESSSHLYFDHLSVFTMEGALIASHPPKQDGMILPTPEETLAFQQVMFEDSAIVLAVPPARVGQTAQVSFIHGLRDSGGQINRVLLARTPLAENPIATPFIKSLKNLENDQGIVQIIDGYGKRLYHTNTNLVMTDYANPRFATTSFFESTTVDNQLMMMFYHPSDQAGWAVVTAFPSEIRHFVAWEIASPLFFVGFAVFLILFLAVFLLVSPLARDLGQLKSGIRSLIERHLPSSENLVNKNNIQYEEIFIRTFDSLNRRIQQQRDLLTIAGPKTRSSNLKQNLMQVMKAALAQGVSSVRIVREDQDIEGGLEISHDSFGLGREARLFASLDQQIYSIVESKGPLTLHDFQIGKRLSLPEGMPCPASLIAFPLSAGKKWFGVLWATFPQKQDPGQEVIEFLRMLSERASDILANNALIKEIAYLQKRMKTALDELPQAILLTDETGKVVYHNARFSEMIDAPHHGLNGQDVLKVFKESELSELVSAIEQGGMDKEVRLANGSALRFRVKPIDIDGRRSGLAMLFEPLKGFKAKLDSSSELVTVVNHALRSPLTLIHGYAKILRLTGNLNDQQDDYIVKIINGIEEMRSLVKNLLDIGRLESLGVMDFSEFPVSQALQKIKDSMEAQFRQKSIKFSVTMPDHPLVIHADFTLLTQALKNLVENALKFTKMGGQVSLSVSEENNNVVFVVKDTGPGIAPLDQRHLFEKFQHDKGVHGEDSAGSGLGLTIVRSIVEHHGGRIWLESQLGQGSTFFIEIPK